MSLPLVSIVTVVRADPKGLMNTCTSLLEQTHQTWEQLIVLSQNDWVTLDVAKKFEDIDPRIKIIYEKEPGIYKAMNQGIEVSLGSYLWFMNSGDNFYSKYSLENSLAHIELSKSSLLIGGYQVEDDGNINSYQQPNSKLTPLRFAFNRRSSCHQSMLFATVAVKQAGGYNSQYRLAADFDLVLRILKSHQGVRFYQTLSKIEPGGISHRNVNKVHSEKHSIRIKHLEFPGVSVASHVWTGLVKLKMGLRNFYLKNF